MSTFNPVRTPGVSKLELVLAQPPPTGDRLCPCPRSPAPSLSSPPFGTARGELLLANLPPFRPTSDLRPSLHALSIFTGTVPVDAILGPCAPASGVFDPKLLPRGCRDPWPTEVADGGSATTGLCSPGSPRDDFIPGDFPSTNTGGGSPLSAYGPAGDGAGLSSERRGVHNGVGARWCAASAGDLPPASDFDVPSDLTLPPRCDLAASLVSNFGRESFDEGHKELPGDGGWTVSGFLCHPQRLEPGGDRATFDEHPRSPLLLGAPPAVVDRSVDSCGVVGDAVELSSVDAPPASLTMKLDRFRMDAKCVAGSLVVISNTRRVGGWRHK